MARWLAGSPVVLVTADSNRVLLYGATIGGGKRISTSDSRGPPQAARTTAMAALNRMLTRNSVSPPRATRMAAMTALARTQPRYTIEVAARDSARVQSPHTLTVIIVMRLRAWTTTSARAVGNS